MPAQVPSFISASNIRLKIANLIRKREEFAAISLSLKYQNGPPVTYKHSTDVGVKQHTCFISCCAYKRSVVYITSPLPSLDNNNNNNNKYIYIYGN